MTLDDVAHLRAWLSGAIPGLAQPALCNTRGHPAAAASAPVDSACDVADLVSTRRAVASRPPPLGQICGAI